MPAESSATSRRVVDLAAYPQRDRKEVWRVVAAPNFDMADLPDEMAAYGVAYDLGPVFLTRSRHPRQTLIRTAVRARRDGADDILCSVELEGAFRAYAGEATLQVSPGRISLWDLSRASTKYSDAGETICLRINRDAWREAVGADLPVHGFTLARLGPLFQDHLLSLERMLSGNPAHASADLGAATLQLLAACLKPELDPRRSPMAQSGVFSLLAKQVERYVQANMADPELTPEQIAQAVGVSRSRLYSVFEHSGGVASFLRMSRLEAAHAMLVRSKQSRIGQVALAVGFSGQTQFNRAFKQYFGYSPGQARELHTS